VSFAQPQHHYRVVFHPMSIGVSPGSRGPLAEVFADYLTLEAAIAGQDALPPLSGYIAVQVIDNAGTVYRERTAGHNIAAAGATW
jgi:hypothetical protein